MIERRKDIAALSDTYQVVHQWMNRHYRRVGRCEYCGQQGKTEYATASHTRYTHNRADWFEFCRRCHLAFDGRLGHMRGRTHTEATRVKIKTARARQTMPKWTPERRAKFMATHAAKKVERSF